MSSTSAVAVLAQGLRDLRDFADGPEPAELSRRTGLTEQQIDAALAGERLPTREVTLALVGAWEGDVEAWREYWGQIAELVRDEGADAGGGAVPVAPEPSIITALPAEGQAPEGEAHAAGNAEPVGAEASEDAAANGEPAADEDEQVADAVEGGAATVVGDGAQAAPVEVSESEAAPAAPETASSGQAASATEAADTPESAASATPEAAHSEQAAGTSGAAASAAPETASSVQAASTTQGPGTAESTATDTPQPARSEHVAHAEGLHPVVLSAEDPTDDQGVPPEPAKKGVLARGGIPVLVFVVGVAVGAFGDHAFSSKSSANLASASLPSASQSQSHAAQPTSAGTSPTRGVSSSSAAVPGGSGTSGTTSTSTSVSPSESSSASASASGSDSASSESSVAPGTTLGTYRGIQLPSAYSVDFLHDTYHPVSGTANGPDTMGFYATSFVDGTFYADKVALLDPQETGDYSSCLDDTRYQKDVLLSKVSAGSEFCVHTSTGHLVLVAVQRMPSSTDANPYAVVDLTVWQE